MSCLKSTAYAILLLFACSAYAETPTSLTAQPTPQQQLKSLPQPSLKKVTQTIPGASYCPQISELNKNGLYWHGPNTWRDFSPSFVSSIRSFGGAQWIGVNVGKIICLYNGLEDNNFPISIERDNLMKKPEGGSWFDDKSTGYKTCKSNDTKDCPFFSQEQLETGNLYDILKGLKKGS